LITRITDIDGVSYTTLQEIRKVFYQELLARFAQITVNEQSVEPLCKANINKLDDEEKSQIDTEITYKELRTAVIQAPKRKSPGLDGISSELYEWGLDIMKEDMERLYNYYFRTGEIPNMHKRGIIVCLPKHKDPERVQDYRPLTLLNAELKIYSRILANRLKPTLHKVMQESQYSAIPERNIIDAAAAIRDIIAAGMGTRHGICLMALDFTRAFDKISHTYLKRMLHSFNYGHRITTAILSLYVNAQSCIAITVILQIHCQYSLGKAVQ
jgi:hypothetical protein